MSVQNKSKFLTFVFSFLPGLGHMYLGLINRGIQFMILFLGTFFLIDFLHISAIPFILPIIWFFGLFDALQSAGKMRSGEEVSDQPLIRWESITTKSRALGFGLIGVGVYILFERVIINIKPLQQVFQAIFGYQGMYVMRSILIAAVLIYVGWRMLTGKPLFTLNKSKSEGEEL